MDRFDLEEQIMQAWSISKDIQTISDSITDNPEDWSIDRISNVLNGLAIINEIKFQKIFQTFEELIGERKIQ